MIYRNFEKLGVSPSLLGFGCMRFPTLPDGKIDETRAENMLDCAMKAGVTYYDTAYMYHDGDSEPFVGRALKKYDRDKFFLATKLPPWKLEQPEDVEKIFNEQLEKLQVEYFDFYLLHSLGKQSWEKLISLGALDVMKRLKAEGKIKYLGFSFHDSYDVFETIIRAEQWDFCQIQLNYIDTEIQAGMKGYHLAEELGIPIVVMEPVKGGSLTTFADDIKDIMKQADPNRSVASWAFRWVASLENVKVVLSGMSTEEQLEDNLKTFDQFEPLNEAEHKLVDRVVSEIMARVKNGCTNCKYCMPCPNGINIPRNFSIWNEYGMYLNKQDAKWNYNDMKEEMRASACVGCAICEEACPQKLPIREHLGLVAEEFKNE